MAVVTSKLPTPTGAVGADLLVLELAETVPDRTIPDTDGVSARRPDHHEQVIDHLNPMMIEFVGGTEMAFVTTADETGECECSLRSGFVWVLDDRTVAYPAAGRDEPAGTVRTDRVRAETVPADTVQIGLLMMADDLVGLQVNGTASVVADARLRGEHPDLPVDGEPERWVLVRVAEAFAVRAAPAAS